MSGSLRVAVDITPLLGPPSGIHQITRGLVDALVLRDDVDVHGYALSARAARASWNRRAAGLGIDVHRSRFPPFPARLVHRTWSRTDFPPRHWVTGRADVVHGTNFVAPPHPRSVISIQDLTLLTRPEWCEPPVAGMAGAVRRAIDRGATIHVSSEAVAAEMRDHFPQARGRIRVVHHAVTPVPPADPTRARDLVGHDRFVLVLGTVERRKNVAAAVRAVLDLPEDVAVAVAGPAGNDESAVAEAGRLLGRRFVRLATVDAATRASLLRSASVLAFPSMYEGFGLPPLEALSVGTPVVATAVGALPELLGDVVGLVPPGDDDAFGDRLTRELASATPPPDEVRERIAMMTWERAAAAMVDVYLDTFRNTVS